ncbi:hypothetical protein ACFQZC_17525 [Streptacidiphilus monticola]
MSSTGSGPDAEGRGRGMGAPATLSRRFCTVIIGTSYSSARTTVGDGMQCP